MNHIYRFIWKSAAGVWQAASELQRGRCKSHSNRRARRLLAAAALSLVAAGASAADVLPTAGTVVASSGAISRNGTNMTVTQATGKLAIDWNSFSIGGQHRQLREHPYLQALMCGDEQAVKLAGYRMRKPRLPRITNSGCGRRALNY
jgi:hypothetical protein